MSLAPALERSPTPRRLTLREQYASEATPAEWGEGCRLAFAELSGLEHHGWSTARCCQVLRQAGGRLNRGQVGRLGACIIFNAAADADDPESRARQREDIEAVVAAMTGHPGFVTNVEKPPAVGQFRTLDQECEAIDGWLDQQGRPDRLESRDQAEEKVQIEADMKTMSKGWNECLAKGMTFRQFCQNKHPDRKGIKGARLEALRPYYDRGEKPPL